MWAPVVCLNFVICWWLLIPEHKLPPVYKFVFQKDKTDIEAVLTQAMLVIAAVAVFVYRRDGYAAVSYIASLVLMLAAFFVKTILRRPNVKRWMLLSAAALVLFLATWQIYFPLILIVYGAILKFLIKAPELTVDGNGVTLKTVFSNKVFPWTDFNSVQVKDGLLVLDYKNNTIKYLPFTEEIQELGFNSFCAAHIEAANP